MNFGKKELKFKVGDKVKVIKQSANQPNIVTGEIVTIIEVDNQDGRLPYRIESIISNNSWIEEEILEKIELKGNDKIKAIIDQGYFYDMRGNKIPVDGEIIASSNGTNYRLSWCYLENPVGKKPKETENEIEIGGKMVSESTIKAALKEYFK